MIAKVKGKSPKAANSAFIHPTAYVSGDVALKENSSVWPNAVIRGDMSEIVIGENTNIQDNSVLHTDTGMPLVIGDNVVVGHNVNLHSCTIGDNSLIGIGAVVLNGAKIGKNCMVAAGAVVPPGKEFPDSSVLMGAPAKAVRERRAEETADHSRLVEHYVEAAKEYKETEQVLY